MTFFSLVLACLIGGVFPVLLAGLLSTTVLANPAKRVTDRRAGCGLDIAHDATIFDPLLEGLAMNTYPKTPAGRPYHRMASA